MNRDVIWLMQMKHTLLVLLCTFVLGGCSDERPTPSRLSENEDVTEAHLIGSLLPNDYVADDTLLMINSASFQPSFSSPDGRFRVAVDENNIVRFVTPVDDAFATTEGASRGTTLKSLRELTGSKLVKDPGWGFTIDLPSGWKAVFCIGDTMTDRTPMESDVVTFLCQR